MLINESVEYLRKKKKVEVTDQYLRQMCYEQKIPSRKFYRFYTIDKKDLDMFAKKFNGVHVGRPKKGDTKC